MNTGEMFQKQKDIPTEPSLRAMLVEILAQSKIYQPSDYWKDLGEYHLRQLSSAGFDNFKRTVNMRYFNWNLLGIFCHQFIPVLAHWLGHPTRSVFEARFSGYENNTFPAVASFNFMTSHIYKWYVAMLADWVSEKDTLGLFKAIDEPFIGNPFIVEWKGRRISQDLCNSIHEFYSIQETEGPLDLFEIGAGYGRLAYIFLRALPSATYCIVDMPPALYISQKYLSSVFPKEKIFYFRHFQSFEEVRDEFETSRIRFLMAHQIELLPEASFDTGISISSLHEMTSTQIEVYIHHVTRLTKKSFYSKQWRRSRVRENNFIRAADYPITTDWKTVYLRRHPIQRMFFEALYEKKSHPDTSEKISSE